MTAHCTLRAVVLWVVMALAACGGSISVFDATAYKLATDLKAESLALTSKATTPAADHTAAIESLRLEGAKALEYERGRPKNDMTTRMWEILLDRDRNLLGGLLKRWEDEGTLGAVFVDEARQQISEAFDQIIGLESGKLKPEEVKTSLFPGLSL